jgi:putative DNA primase/helicase
MIASLHEVARALGGEVHGGQVLAPGPGHGARDRSLALRISATAPEGFIAFSHARDDWQACRDYVKQRLGLDRDSWKRERPEALKRPAPTPVDVGDKRKAEFERQIIREIARELEPVAVSPEAKRYLEDVRLIDTTAVAGVLNVADAIGWHPAVYFNEPGHVLHGRKLGAIIGIMTDPISAEPTGGISRTYLHEGGKVGKAKGLGPAGIVRLTADEEVLGGLHLTEGLETGLDMMARNFRPIWSCGSTSIMAKMPVVSGIECLTILADHDENGAGERAALELERRWREAGREVLVVAPAAPGDFNDITMRGSL